MRLPSPRSTNSLAFAISRWLAIRWEKALRPPEWLRCGFEDPHAMGTTASSGPSEWLSGPVVLVRADAHCSASVGTRAYASLQGVLTSALSRSSLISGAEV